MPDIVKLAKDIQVLNGSNRNMNLSLSAFNTNRPKLFAQKGYNAELGKMITLSSDGLVGTSSVLTSTLPLQRGKAILFDGAVGLF